MNHADSPDQPSTGHPPNQERTPRARWLIRRDGTLLDRNTRTVIGRVWYDSARDFRWCAESPTSTHFGAAKRRFAAAWAWHEWHIAAWRRRNLITQTLSETPNRPDRDRNRNRGRNRIPSGVRRQLDDLIEGFLDDQVPTHLLVGDLNAIRPDLSAAQRELVAETIDLISARCPPNRNPETPAR